MLTVYCVFWGDKYPIYYVDQLRQQVRNNLQMPHQFVCLTDNPAVMGITRKPSRDYPGWWNKINLFKPRKAQGPCLYLDLDVVVTGDLTDLVLKHKNCDLAAPANWAQSGHNSIQSSVLIWRGDNAVTRQLWDNYKPESDPTINHWPPTNAGQNLWGDQEYYTRELGQPGDGVVTEITKGEVVSYKYHCTNGLPAQAKVVVFHGKPDPHEVSDPWVVSRLSTPIPA